MNKLQLIKTDNILWEFEWPIGYLLRSLLRGKKLLFWLATFTNLA